MKLHLRSRALCLAALVLAALWASPLAAAEDSKPREPWQEAAIRMSKVQALLEYYFMETGSYPPSLEALDRSFNTDLPDKAPRVSVPTDPATSKPFSYELLQEGRRYRLAAPDPSKYGDRALTLDSIDWGWMAFLARQRRIEQLALECKYNMEVLATQSEMFAKDNGGKFPQSVDALVPKYLPRHPTCPLSGKNYVFTANGKGYYIGCPNAEAHGLKKFGYSSEKGMVVEQLPAPTPKGGAPGDSSAPKPESGK